MHKKEEPEKYFLPLLLECSSSLVVFDSWALFSARLKNRYLVNLGCKKGGGGRKNLRYVAEATATIFSFQMRMFALAEADFLMGRAVWMVPLGCVCMATITL